MGISSICPRCSGETWNYSCPDCDAETMADLRDQVEVLNQELAITRKEVVAQTKAKEEALADIARFKAGNMTDSELQEICHNLPTEKVCEFRKGCQDHQVKMFGEDKVKSEVARELRWALRQISFAYGMDGLAEGMASAIIDNDHLKPPCKENEGRIGSQ